MKSKIGLFCSVRSENVIAATDSESIYEVPLVLFEENFDSKVVDALSLDASSAKMEAWKRWSRFSNTQLSKPLLGLLASMSTSKSYKSLHEALVHGGIANKSAVNIVYIDAEKLTNANVSNALKEVDSVLVPGGFGSRGAEGKMVAIRYARENGVPFFGICFGMQLAAVEFARNVCGIQDATSREFQKKKSGRNTVIDFMEDQKNLKEMGGTMRLGSYDCSLKKGTRVLDIYGQTSISERHRHRYEFNNKFGPIFEKNGMNLAGINRTRDLVEILEITEHPWFIGVQFHPEFQSKPLHSHPLFTDFVKASLQHGQLTQKPKSEKKTKRSRASRSSSSSFRALNP